MDHYTDCGFCGVRRYDAGRGFDRCFWCHRIRRDGLVVAVIDYLEEAQELGYDRSGASMMRAYERMVESGDIEDPEPSDVDTAQVIIDSHDAERTARERISRTSRSRQGAGCFILCLVIALPALVVALLGACSPATALDQNAIDATSASAPAGSVAEPIHTATGAEECPTEDEQGYLDALDPLLEETATASEKTAHLLLMSGQDPFAHHDDDWLLSLSQQKTRVDRVAASAQELHPPPRGRELHRHLQTAVAELQKAIHLWVDATAPIRAASGEYDPDEALVSKAGEHVAAYTMATNRLTDEIGSFCD